jgi:signal recognition particle subunit SRP54
LTDRLSNAFKHLKSKGKLSEADIDGTIREIRRALLDADVALDVVRSFTARCASVHWAPRCPKRSTRRSRW